MTHRAILPGALLALLVAGTAALALALALGIRGDGPLNLLLGGSDGTVRLPDRVSVAPVGSAGLQPGPVARPAAGAPTVVLPATAGAPASARRRTPDLRGESQTRRPARRGPAQAPTRPIGVPSPPAPVAQSAPTTSTTAPAPAATPAPAAVRVRGRGREDAASAPTVPKTRVRSARPTSPVATPAPAASPAPRADAPVVELRPYRPEQPDTAAGSDSGVLKRVPPGPPQ